MSLAADVTEIGAPPSNTVDIVGLSEAAMSEFWREVLTGEDKGFQLAGHNCSTVVAGALKHGYAAQFSGRCQEPQSSGHYHA